MRGPVGAVCADLHAHPSDAGLFLLEASCTVHMHAALPKISRDAQLSKEVCRGQQHEQRTIFAVCAPNSQLLSKDVMVVCT